MRKIIVDFYIKTFGITVWNYVFYRNKKSFMEADEFTDSGEMRGAVFVRTGT